MSPKPKTMVLNPEPIKPKYYVLFVDISNLRKTPQFLLCSGAVFLFFLLYGYMQELIFTIDGFRPYGWYLTLVQFGFYSIFALIETNITGIGPRKIPMTTYFILAFLTLGTMGFSNASLGYLNYPTQVIFKCCKLIPVLVGGILIQGKRYRLLDFVAAFLMCIGLASFTLADSHVQPSFNMKGITMISMALLCDAIIGNVQEKSMKNSGAANAEVVLYSYALGFLYILVVMLISGDFIDGLNFFAKDPRKTYGYAFIFSFTGYLGIQVVLTLVRTTGAFAAVTVTTFRKAVSIVMSFIFFSKPFTIQYIWSGSLVVMGVYLNFFSKNNSITMTECRMRIDILPNLHELLLLCSMSSKVCSLRPDSFATGSQLSSDHIHRLQCSCHSTFTGKKGGCNSATGTVRLHCKRHQFLQAKKIAHCNNHDRSLTKKEIRSFELDDKVLFRNYNGDKWLPGKVQQKNGTFTYTITSLDGQKMSRHIDQLLPRVSVEDEESNEIQNRHVAGLGAGVSNDTNDDSTTGIDLGQSTEDTSSRNTQMLRRSERNPRKPNYLRDFI
ncbi:hypothetical protein JTB14_024219 [Gonioctena quinquepunctata]|nr:hypothetical protein JTB14_024219 [Gonioctena quinquepunctata]